LSDLRLQVTISRAGLEFGWDCQSSRDVQIMNSKVGEMRKGFLKIISPDNSVCPVVPNIVTPASISSQFSMTLFSTANVPPKFARSCDVQVYVLYIRGAILLVFWRVQTFVRTSP
jgi:hypothetical protein